MLNSPFALFYVKTATLEANEYSFIIELIVLVEPCHAFPTPGNPERSASLGLFI